MVAVGAWWRKEVFAFANFFFFFALCALRISSFLVRWVNRAVMEIGLPLFIAPHNYTGFNTDLILVWTPDLSSHKSDWTRSIYPLKSSIVDNCESGLACFWRTSNGDLFNSAFASLIWLKLLTGMLVGSSTRGFHHFDFIFCFLYIKVIRT